MAAYKLRVTEVAELIFLCLTYQFQVDFLAPFYTGLNTQIYNLLSKEPNMNGLSFIKTTQLLKFFSDFWPENRHFLTLVDKDLV